VNCGCSGSAAELRFAQLREHFQRENALEHFTLEMVADGGVNSPCDHLAARIRGQIPAERMIHFQ
jgi:hypothetical protein